MLEGWGIGEGMMPISPSGPRCRYKPVAGKYGDRQRSFRAAGGRASPKGFLRAENSKPLTTFPLFLPACGRTVEAWQKW